MVNKINIDNNYTNKYVARVQPAAQIIVHTQILFYLKKTLVGVGSSQVLKNTFIKI